MTFREICEQERENAAKILFDKAVLYGQMSSRVVTKSKDRKTLRNLKSRYVVGAILLSSEIEVTIDNDYQIGLPSIRHRGKRVHVMRESLVGVA